MTSGLKPGTTLQDGKYVVKGVLGQGGFGITYFALHTLLDIPVAIKEFYPKDLCNRESETTEVTVGATANTVLVERLKGKFIKEARTIARLSHPNIVRIHDVFIENGTAYYVMDFIEGKSLKEIIETRGALPQAEALKIIEPVAMAVDCMHRHHINHLDIKPANIMVCSADNRPVLIDFGTSKQYDMDGVQTSTMAAGLTHGYAPAEQYKPGGVASFTPQTDIYALGATLYTMLQGVKPPHYTDILESGLPKLSDAVDANVSRAVVKAMSVAKNGRQESITEFLSELKRTNPQPKVKRNYITWAGVALAVVTIALFAVIFSLLKNANDDGESVPNEVVGESGLVKVSDIRNAFTDYLANEDKWESKESPYDWYILDGVPGIRNDGMARAVGYDCSCYLGRLTDERGEPIMLQADTVPEWNVWAVGWYKPEVIKFFPTQCYSPATELYIENFARAMGIDKMENFERPSSYSSEGEKLTKWSGTDGRLTFYVEVWENKLGSMFVTAWYGSPDLVKKYSEM